MPSWLPWNGPARHIAMLLLTVTAFLVLFSGYIAWLYTWLLEAGPDSARPASSAALVATPCHRRSIE